MASLEAERKVRKWDYLARKRRILRRIWQHQIVRPRLVAVQEFLQDASDLDPITDVLLLDEMIINHLAQVILSEENSHRVSL